jgi:heterotetrameric sarcosine oxidase delta subunit
MLIIRCPWCGPRDEAEFICDGEHAPRPVAAEADDATWAHYLYYRGNARDFIEEHWVHAFGCEQWLVVERHSVTNEIRGVRPVRPFRTGSSA